MPAPNSRLRTNPKHSPGQEELSDRCERSPGRTPGNHRPRPSPTRHRARPSAARRTAGRRQPGASCCRRLRSRRFGQRGGWCSCTAWVAAGSRKCPRPRAPKRRPPHKFPRPWPPQPPRQLAAIYRHRSHFSTGAYCRGGTPGRGLGPPGRCLRAAPIAQRRWPSRQGRRRAAVLAAGPRRRAKCSAPTAPPVGGWGRVAGEPVAPALSDRQSRHRQSCPRSPRSSSAYRSSELRSSEHSPCRAVHLRPAARKHLQQANQDAQGKGRRESVQPSQQPSRVSVVPPCGLMRGNTITILLASPQRWKPR